jgi:hypothetical protein
VIGFSRIIIPSFIDPVAIARPSPLFPLSVLKAASSGAVFTPSKEVPFTIVAAPFPFLAVPPLIIIVLLKPISHLSVSCSVEAITLFSRRLYSVNYLLQL